MTECPTEQAAATVLGYTQLSWDNLNDTERQPWQSRMPWASLNSLEQQSAQILGYTQLMWDDRTSQPASFYKKWSQLTACGKYEIVCIWPSVLVHCRPSTMLILAAKPCLFLVHSGVNVNGGTHFWTVVCISLIMHTLLIQLAAALLR